MSSINEGMQKAQLLTETRTYKLWEDVGHKIMEAQLTPNQINQLFANIEQGATAAGGNRTAIGKGKDVASAVNKAWEDLKTKASNSGPIKNMDAMYDQAAEKLKQATGGDQGVMKYVQKYRDFAKKHPVAQSLIYGALIAAAGITGAGVGGAAALGLFKMVDKLLQGEKFSSAAYQGIKTGALAYGASKLGDLIKNTFSPVTKSGTIGYNGPGGSVFQATYKDGKVTELILGDKVITPNDPGFTEAVKTWNALRKARDAEMAKLGSDVGMDLSLGNVSKDLGANESTLSEATIALLFTRIDEGLWDTIKGKAQQVGKNLTTKVTADKLMKMWRAAGSPTDTDQITKVLTQNGVSQAVIDAAYKQLNIKQPNDKQAKAMKRAPGNFAKPAGTKQAGPRQPKPAVPAPAAQPASNAPVAGVRQQGGTFAAKSLYKEGSAADDSAEFKHKVSNIVKQNPKGSASEKMILNRFLSSPMYNTQLHGKDFVNTALEWLQRIKVDLTKKFPDADLSDLEDLAHKMYEDYLARIGQLEESNLPPRVAFNKKPKQKGPGYSKDDYEYTEFVPKGKEDKEAWAIKRTVSKQQLKKPEPKSMDTGFYKSYLSNRPIREEEIDEASKAEVRAELDQAIKDFLAKGGQIEKLKPNKVKAKPGMSMASKHIGTPGEFGRKPQARFLAGKGRQINPGKPVVNVEEGEVVSLAAKRSPLVIAGSPYDWDIYDLRTNQRVANILGGDRHDIPLYEIRIKSSGMTSTKMPPTYILRAGPNNTPPYKAYELVAPEGGFDKIEKSPGPGGATKLHPDKDDMLRHMMKNLGGGKYYGYDLDLVEEGLNQYELVEKALGAKIMEVDDAIELGYTDWDPNDSSSIVYLGNKKEKVDELRKETISNYLSQASAAVRGGKQERPKKVPSWKVAAGKLYPDKAMGKYAKVPASGIMQGVAEGSNELDQQAMDIATKLTTGKNLEKLRGMVHDSTVYRALDRYFEKHNIPETIYNRVAYIVFQKINQQGVSETTSTGTSVGSAGIGGSSGIGTEASPIVQAFQNQIDEHINTPGGMGQSYRKYTPKVAGMDENLLNTYGDQLGLDEDVYTNSLYKEFLDSEYNKNQGSYIDTLRNLGQFIRSKDMPEDKVKPIIRRLVAKLHPSGLNEDDMALAELKCWQGYKRVPGTKEGEKGSCVKKESAIIKGLQSEEKVNEYDVDGSKRKIVFSKENPPDLYYLYQQFIQKMLAPDNTVDPNDWIDKVNKHYGLNYTWKDYQKRGHNDQTNNWQRIIDKYILKKS